MCGYIVIYDSSQENMKFLIFSVFFLSRSNFFRYCVTSFGYKAKQRKQSKKERKEEYQIGINGHDHRVNPRPCASYSLDFQLESASRCHGSETGIRLYK